MSEVKSKNRAMERGWKAGVLHRRLLYSPVFIGGVALLVRVVAIALLQGAHAGQLSKIWESGPEISNIASSLASHRGFSSPFGVESGPTAWIPPVYPSLLAGIFAVVGLRSSLAAATILGFQAVFAAVTCIPLYAVARRTFDDRVAAWSSWAWALFPHEVVMPGLFVWETFLSGLLAVVLCDLSICERGDDSGGVVAGGLLWGFAALTNTALLSFMPLFLFAMYHRKDVAVAGKRLATVILISILTVGPWVARNWHVFRTFVPVRSNFGEELWKGNHAGGKGRIEFGIGPADNPIQRERYRRMGEIAYVRQRRMQATEFIRQNPDRYARLLLYRFEYWWWAQGESAPIFIFYRLLTVMSLVGIVLALLRIRNPRMLILLGAILIYPLVYYLTDVYARYRYPIEPFMMIFAGFALSQWVGWAGKKLAGL